ncbi:MAG TPA: hypothetical protein VFO16_11845 [Pseudonocardiaceae bacterium]|nr:hypothetical protein [Pseudonocardiaceae bacterium]
MTPDDGAETRYPVRPYRRVHESESPWGPVRQLPAGGPPTRRMPGAPPADGKTTEFSAPPGPVGTGPPDGSVTIPIQNGSPPDGRAPWWEQAQSPPQVRPAERETRIALWGATSSGKTTYLWTLPLAAEAQGWTVTPLDQASEAFKDRAEFDLTTEGLLPTGTQKPVQIRWKLEQPPGVEGPRWRRREIPGSQIVLSTIERSGGDFETVPPGVTEQLAEADGIVYLFDPDRELNQNSPNNVKYFIAAMNSLRRRSHEMDRMVDGRLPHHLAVCVTKLDAVKVFAKAREGFWVTQAAEWPHFPQVAPQHAQPFFEWLCRTELGDAANFVRDRIVANFLPHRVTYFVCSAIGFGLNGDRLRDGRGQFDLSDFSNLTSEGNRVRGMPRPINVLEPLVALERSRRPSSGLL